MLCLGAVLYQVHDGVEKVTSYASRSLTRSKTKYPVPKLEFLCLKWAITEQFCKYLYGNTFDVYTDNNPLAHVLTSATLDAMGHRWITGLANYNFHILYRSRQCNVEADALSRIDWEKSDETIQADSIQAILTAAITGQENDYIEASPQTIESLLLAIPDNAQIICKANMMSEIKLNSGNFSHPDSPLNPQSMTMLDWMRVQAEDKVIGDIIQRYQAK